MLLGRIWEAFGGTLRYLGGILEVVRGFGFMLEALAGHWRRVGRYRKRLGGPKVNHKGPHNGRKKVGTGTPENGVRVPAVLGVGGWVGECGVSEALGCIFGAPGGSY